MCFELHIVGEFLHREDKSFEETETHNHFLNCTTTYESHVCKISFFWKVWNLPSARFHTFERNLMSARFHTFECQWWESMNLTRQAWPLPLYLYFHFFGICICICFFGICILESHPQSLTPSVLVFSSPQTQSDLIENCPYKWMEYESILLSVSEDLLSIFTFSNTCDCD